MIERPEIQFDGASHTYWHNGEKLLGVSTVAKIGGAEDTWGVASAWGFRIGYEGAWDIAASGPLVSEDGKLPWSKDELREQLKRRGLTPWSKRDQAADRGNYVHDVLEGLAQDGTVPMKDEWTDEIKGHVRAIYNWYVDYRPSFVATEVQVASMEHGFSGRYDVRALVPAFRLVPLFDGHESPQATRVRLAGEESCHTLCLIDLKTSKRVYPCSHFAQLAGYEIASVEMGFPATDAQLVLNTHPDGTYDFAASWAESGDFLAYLGALRAIRRMKAADPEERARVRREEAILAALPATSRHLADTLPELAGFDARGTGFILGGLRKRGLVTQEGAIWTPTKV